MDQPPVDVMEHRAAIAAGGVYRCRPDSTGTPMALCVAVFAMFVPTTLIGLSVNPAVGGYIFLTVAAAVPLLGFVGLLLVRRNSCFFVDNASVGRRNWRGRVVAEIPRTGIRFATLIDRSGGRYRDKALSVVGKDGSLPATGTYWWSDKRIREFAAVAGIQLR